MTSELQLFGQIAEKVGNNALLHNLILGPLADRLQLRNFGRASARVARLACSTVRRSSSFLRIRISTAACMTRRSRVTCSLALFRVATSTCWRRFCLLLCSLGLLSSAVDCLNFVINVLNLLPSLVFKLKPLASNLDQISRATTTDNRRSNGHRLVGQGAHGTLGLHVGVVANAAEKLVPVYERHDLLQIAKCLLLDRLQVLRLFSPFLELCQDKFHA